MLLILHFQKNVTDLTNSFPPQLSYLLEKMSHVTRDISKTCVTNASILNPYA